MFVCNCVCVFVCNCVCEVSIRQQWADSKWELRVSSTSLRDTRRMENWFHTQVQLSTYIVTYSPNANKIENLKHANTEMDTCMRHTHYTHPHTYTCVYTHLCWEGVVVFSKALFNSQSKLHQGNYSIQGHTGGWVNSVTITKGQKPKCTGAECNCMYVCMYVRSKNLTKNMCGLY